MSSDVDPKRVLQLVNSMGYKNVSAKELKHFTKDLKKLMKYEEKTKPTSGIIPKVRQAPENVINVTIIKEVSPVKTRQRPTTTTVGPTTVVQKQNEDKNSEIATTAATAATATEKRQSKKVLRLPKHINANNPKVVFKKNGINTKNGVYIRNTPTDLYQKYQQDWAKFKSFIPGENGRSNVRNSVRRKMEQKDTNDAKVYVHFPDETGDH